MCAVTDACSPWRRRRRWTPDGRITKTFRNPADREAAFRFLEAGTVSRREIGEAAGRAAARRSSAYPWVFVPGDGSSLKITDGKGTKGLGLVGARKKEATGLQVMSAIAVAPDGTPLGLCAQEYWARKERSTRKSAKKDTRSVGEKETRYWLKLMDATREQFSKDAPRTRPWFQLDRGADAGIVMCDAIWASEKSWVTIRAAYDRRLVDAEGGHLWERLEAQEPAGAYVLDVPGDEHRTARQAHMQLRHCAISVGVHIPGLGSAPVPMQAVLAREEGTAPAGEAALEWMLLTTYPVGSVEEAQLVVLGYSLRWRVEQFHKTWKTGACRVEETQLRETDRILVWATILACVAMRIQRLTYIARSTPDVPATVELAPVEIEATILLRKPSGVKRKDVPTLGQVVRWIADLGGYTGKSSGGPPGAHRPHPRAPSHRAYRDGSLRRRNMINGQGLTPCEPDCAR